MQFEQATTHILDKLAAELPAHLSYHSIDHVRDVYHAAEQIGKAEGISGDDMKLLLTAACYHDAGFLKGGKGHEEESCRVVNAVLPGFDYTTEQITKICGMIMATKLPQSPQNHLEEILADADLDYLGRDDFFTTGHKLSLELSAGGIIANEGEWNRLQVKFLEGHHYFTKTSQTLRQAKKEEHLQQVKEKLNQ